MIQFIRRSLPVPIGSTELGNLLESNTVLVSTLDRLQGLLTLLSGPTRGHMDDKMAAIPLGYDVFLEINTAAGGFIAWHDTAIQRLVQVDGFVQALKALGAHRRHSAGSIKTHSSLRQRQ